MFGCVVNNVSKCFLTLVDIVVECGLGEKFSAGLGVFCSAGAGGSGR